MVDTVFSIANSILLFVVIGATMASAQTVATLQGVLLKANGKPRLYTEIELVPVGSKKLVIDSRLISASDTRGRFTFFDVPPGQYNLSINFNDKPTELSPYDTFFYPSAFERENAEVLTIDRTTKLRNIIFRLPSELTSKLVTGRVIWEDGSRVSSAMIGFWDLRIDTSALGPGSTMTDMKGNFKVTGFEGRRYQMCAVAFDRIPKSPFEPQPHLIGAGETTPFTVRQQMNEIEITIKRASDRHDIWNKYFGEFEALMLPKHYEVF